MKRIAYIVLVLLVLSSNAFAHSVGGDSGFVSGIVHPILGMDHLLAMVSVGILSTQIGGKAVWHVPLTFICVMGIGGFLGMQSVAVPYVEFGIVLSVIILGLALVIDKRVTVVIPLVCVSVFAIFHGHAHGTEMPHIADPYFYAFGFLLGTAIIHIIGVSLGLFVHRYLKQPVLLRYMGGGIACVGVVLFIEKLFA